MKSLLLRTKNPLIEEKKGLKMNSIVLSLLGFICISINAFGGNTPKQTPTLQTVQEMSRNQGLLFQENLGQLTDPSGKSLTAIKYFGSQGGVSIYCEPAKLSFVFAKIINKDGNTNPVTGQFSNDLKPGSITIVASRVELEFIGSNPNTQIIAEEKQMLSMNYFLDNTAENGVLGIRSYKKLVYKNFYSNIDMVIITSGNGIEYSFIVHPGGNVSDIKTRWNGTDKTEELANGGKLFSNSLGSMVESAPKSFVDGKEVQSNFINQIDSRGFEVSVYNNSRDLLIDPDLSWATYYGGSGIDYGYAIASDGSGNVYLTGTTYTTTGLATSGAYQTTFAGSTDAFIVKFSPSGSRLWCTYYGGSGYDYGYGIGTDASGNVFITGETASGNGISTTGSYQKNRKGDFDAFLAKFSSSGSRLWGTYFGGNFNEIGKGLSMDSSGNIFITGLTSSTNFISSNGSFQSGNGGAGDAYLAKFNSAGSRLWGTYIGGSGSDYGNAVSADASGNVFVSGYTFSSNAMATSGAYQTTYAGAKDAFLAKFSASGARLWSTYYGGTSTDEINGVRADASGNVFITGTTSSTSGIATSGAYQTTFGGGFYGPYDAFLGKFNSSGNISWATYYGGSLDDYALDVTTDASGNVYITGQTYSTNNIATTGAYQTTNAGGATYAYDGFLAQFSSVGSLSWATYYGGFGQDWGSGVCIDPFGNIYMSGSSNSTSGIATIGAYQTSNAGSHDLIIVKFVIPSNAPGSVGISSASQTEKPIKIYPNPSHGEFTIQSIADGYYTISNTLGQNIQIVQTNALNNYSAQIYDLNNGIYFIEGISNGTIIREKIIVTR